MSDKLNTLTDGNWDNEVLKNPQLSMIDVWAPWCGPCRVIGPVVEELADDYHGKVNVGKLNADENQLPGQLGVSGIPTILFFKDGIEIDRVVGAVPKQHLVEKIEYHLGSEAKA
ncbi:thioredoxin [Candidatus Neomarinimicrobiota bacterium]